MSLPSLKEGLDRLLGVGKQISCVVDTYEPTQAFAARIAKQTPPLSSMDTISRIRDEVLTKYNNSQVGHLLSNYVLNRDKQMATLSGLGKDVILSVLAQGVLPAQLATALEVSYETFNEFVKLTTTPEEYKRAEQLAADAMVSRAMTDLSDAVDKDDLYRAKAIAEYTFKLAKTMNNRYSDKGPSTAIQVNQYGESHSEPTTSKPYLQIVLPDIADLPPLKPHSYTAETRESTFKATGFIDGEFTLYSGEDEEQDQ